MKISDVADVVLNTNTTVFPKDLTDIVAAFAQEKPYSMMYFGRNFDDFYAAYAQKYLYRCKSNGEILLCAFSEFAFWGKPLIVPLDFFKNREVDEAVTKRVSEKLVDLVFDISTVIFDFNTESDHETVLLNAVGWLKKYTSKNYSIAAESFFCRCSELCVLFF